MKLHAYARLLSFACIIYISKVQASNPVETTRNTTKEWIAVEKSIASESAAWLEKQTLLQDLIRVTEAEIKTLQTSIAEIESIRTTADATRESLLAEQETLRLNREVIETFLEEMEPDLKALNQRLPQPLVDKLAPLYQRLPEGPAKTSPGIAERMQAVVALLTAIHQFDRKVTVSEEIQTFADGAQGEVKSVYIGLGAAYYRTRSGDDAGIGYPADKGWGWKSQPELGKHIADAIAIAEQSALDVNFVALPVTLQD